MVHTAPASSSSSRCIASARATKAGATYVRTLAHDPHTPTALTNPPPAQAHSLLVRLFFYQDEGHPCTRARRQLRVPACRFGYQ